MRKIDYDVYFDKVYGCFLGKCIGGTAGGPAEGRKELLDAPLNEELLHLTLPNDDLDLQILWLELLENKGAYITARDMAEEFCKKVPYGPGEYAYSMKNIECGIYPPVSGSFNNRYYKNGMGCPIRSEIWACLFPGAPTITEKYVRMDGSFDHESDSIDAEYFLATLESEAFFANGYTDIITLVKYSLEKINSGTKIHSALSDALEFYLSGKEWQWARGEILRRYGHSDCTNLYQNMAFIVLTLLYCNGDFREVIRLGLAMGYDTDCVCATVAAILGILYGANALLDYGMTDIGIQVGIKTSRQSGSIKQLSQDICAVGISMSELFSDATEILKYPDFKRIPTTQIPEFYITAQYVEKPVLLPNKSTRINLLVQRNAGDTDLHIEFEHSKDICVDCSVKNISLHSGESVVIGIDVSVCTNADVLHKRNIIKIKLGDFSDTFGLMGGTVWHRYGPFLMNNQDLTNIVAPHEVYAEAVVSDGDNSQYDALRDYHLNTFADIHKEFVPEKAPFVSIEPNGSAECDFQTIYTDEDLFALEDIQQYCGPHTDYLKTVFMCPEEREIELAVGHTAPFKLWVNGQLIGESEKNTWWTCENRHLFVTLKKGENVFILKCAQQTHSAWYSLIPRHGDKNWRQWSDIDCKIL